VCETGACIAWGPHQHIFSFFFFKRWILQEFCIITPRRNHVLKWILTLQEIETKDTKRAKRKFTTSRNLHSRWASPHKYAISARKPGQVELRDENLWAAAEHTVWPGRPRDTAASLNMLLRTCLTCPSNKRLVLTRVAITISS